MPPWIMWLDADDAPEAKSPRSTRTTSTPWRARSRNVDIPLMPPPMSSTVVRPDSRSARTSSRSADECVDSIILELASLLPPQHRPLVRCAQAQCTYVQG